MSDGEVITGDSARWPHLEAAYRLAGRAATGFAPGDTSGAAFAAARWGLHMGLAIARLDPELARAIGDETDGYDLARDGEEATAFARFVMTRDVTALGRAADRLRTEG